jgi:hypothetical protein
VQEVPCEYTHPSLPDPCDMNASTTVALRFKPAGDTRLVFWCDEHVAAVINGLADRDMASLVETHRRIGIERLIE